MSHFYGLPEGRKGTRREKYRSQRDIAFEPLPLFFGSNYRWSPSYNGLNYDVFKNDEEAIYIQ